MDYPNMGKQGEDIITGFKGTVTGFCIYISGCNQVLLIPRNDPSKEKQPDGRWVDEQRVAFSGEAIVLDNSLTPGPDAPAPIR